MITLAQFKKYCFDNGYHILMCRQNRDQTGYIVRWQTFKIVRGHKPKLRFSEPKTKTFKGNLLDVYSGAFTSG